MNLKVTSYLVAGWCLLVFAFGLFSFPDAPFKPCTAEAGYCGKTGQPHTKSEYEAQVLWERTLLVSWPFGIAAAIYLSRLRRRGGK